MYVRAGMRAQVLNYVLYGPMIRQKLDLRRELKSHAASTAVAAVARNASKYAWRRLKQVLVCSAAQAAAAVAASHGVLGPGGCGTPPPTGTLPVSEDTSP